ncbi:MAG: heavy metal translocating P-type ATPase, partial [Gammaproteobacteria bacterium]|nr:heavy metal translocating P-type ATPase [Gammaproteobacteria bacterium]
MGSNHCAGLITTSVERLPGIISLTTNIANHRVQVEFDAKLTSDNQIRSAIEKAGYDVDSITSIPSRKIGEAVFMVPGMGSDHCAGLVSSSVKRLAGITDTSTNIANHKVTVRFDVATVDA